MTDKMAETPTEGDQAFPSVDEDNTSTDSPSENNDTDETRSVDGDDEENSQQDTDGDDDNADSGEDGDEDDSKKTPFHDHPRWKLRETEWDTRFNDQESRHQEDMKQLREDITKAPKAPAESAPIPTWFGGDQAQWDAYQADRAGEIKAAEDRVLESVNGKRTAEQKAVQEATDYMKSEVVSIETNKNLNPSGKKVDSNKLLKIVMDNELIDSKGRWNYKAGMIIMNAQSGIKPAQSSDDKKKIAGATTSDSKGEDKPKAFKTTKDFKMNKPW